MAKQKTPKKVVWTPSPLMRQGRRAKVDDLTATVYPHEDGTWFWAVYDAAGTRRAHQERIPTRAKALKEAEQEIA